MKLFCTFYNHTLLRKDTLFMSYFAAPSSEITGVLIADSNRMQSQLLMSALRRYGNFKISLCRMEISAVIHAADARSPKLALLAPSPFLSVADNMATVRQFHAAHPEIAKIILLEYANREATVSAFRAGVRGVFVIGDGNLRLLHKCIARVAAGQAWINTEQMNYLLEAIAETPSVRVVNAKGDQLLTRREEQVVALVAEGLANRDIARELNLSEHTVKKYLFRIFEKIGVSSRVELVLYAINHGMQRAAEWLPFSPPPMNLPGI